MLQAVKCEHLLCEACYQDLDPTGETAANRAFCGGALRYCLIATLASSESFATHRFLQFQDALDKSTAMEGTEDWDALAAEEENALRNADSTYVDPATLPPAPVMPTIVVRSDGDEGTNFAIVLNGDVVDSWQETEETDKEERYFNRLFRCHAQSTVALCASLSRKDSLPDLIRDRVAKLNSSLPADVRDSTQSSASVPLPPEEELDPNVNSQRIRPGSSRLLAERPRRVLHNCNSQKRLDELDKQYREEQAALDARLRSAAERTLENFVQTQGTGVRRAQALDTRFHRHGNGADADSSAAPTPKRSKTQAVFDNAIKLSRATAGKHSTIKTYAPAQQRFVDWCNHRAKWAHRDGINPKVSLRSVMLRCV